jgi:hypothetical protein
MATQFETLKELGMRTLEASERTASAVEALVALMTAKESVKTQAPAKKSQAGKAATTSKPAAPAKEKVLTPEDIAHKAVACKRADRKAPLVGDGTAKPNKQAWAEERTGGVFIFARTLESAARALGTLPKGLVVEQFPSSKPYKQTSTWWVKSGSLAQAQDFAAKVK